jgi:hypothetical protein
MTDTSSPLFSTDSLDFQILNDVNKNNTEILKAAADIKLDTGRQTDNTLGHITGYNTAQEQRLRDSTTHVLSDLHRGDDQILSSVDRNGTAGVLTTQRIANELGTSVERNGTAGVLTSQRVATELGNAIERTGTAGVLTSQRTANEIAQQIYQQTQKTDDDVNSAKWRGTDEHGRQIVEGLKSSFDTQKGVMKAAEMTNMLSHHQYDRLMDKQHKHRKHHDKTHRRQDRFNHSQELLAAGFFQRNQHELQDMHRSLDRDACHNFSTLQLQAANNTSAIQIDALRNRSDIIAKIEDSKDTILRRMCDDKTDDLRSKLQDANTRNMFLESCGRNCCGDDRRR